MGNYQTKIHVNCNYLFFNIRSSQKLFLIGTNICDDTLERFDDMETIGLKSLLKLKYIEFYFYENVLVGYETQYIDQFEQNFKIVRLPQKFKRSNHDFQKKHCIYLDDTEHIVSLLLTFTHESISSVTLVTNMDKTVSFGKEKEFTTITDYQQKVMNKINVITAFAGTCDYSKLKELFVYRAQINLN